MWVLSLCHQLSKPMRAATGFLCLMLLVGPGLFIAGMIILTTPNARQQGIVDYNNAGDTYAKTDSPLMAATTGTFAAGGSLAVASQSLQILGNQEGIRTFQSIFLQGFQPADTKFPLTLTLTGRGSTTLDGVVSDISRSSTTDILCTDAECVGSGGGCTCPLSSMRSKCAGTFTATTSSCTKDVTCGRCELVYYLTTACFVAQMTSAGTWRPSPLQSCFYPFTTSSNSYSTVRPSSVTIRVRSETDPFIVLQRLTEGKEDFGLSQENQIAKGTILVGVGVAITAVAAGLMFLVLWRLSIMRSLTAKPHSPDDEAVAADEAAAAKVRRDTSFAYQHEKAATGAAPARADAPAAKKHSSDATAKPAATSAEVPAASSSSKPSTTAETAV